MTDYRLIHTNDIGPRKRDPRWFANLLGTAEINSATYSRRIVVGIGEYRMNRRDFLANGLTMIAAAMVLTGCQGFDAAEHRYKLAPKNILPPDIAKAHAEVREAYRFAITNRDTLRYIPCYCSCGSEGHTSNASCYVKDSSTYERPEFDRMSLA